MDVIVDRNFLTNRHYFPMYFGQIIDIAENKLPLKFDTGRNAHFF